MLIVFHKNKGVISLPARFLQGHKQVHHLNAKKYLIKRTRFKPLMTGMGSRF
jgi:hypothetical protein